MVTREEVRQRMQDDGIEYLFAQFVDIHGSPKVKMVPASHQDDVIDVGAGFAGGALMGMGQGPHSHDMMARVDLDTYSVAPWTEGVARFACDLYVDDEPHMYCPRTNLKRMLAYSTIAHMGFLLLGILAANSIGYAASMFYVIVYALMSMGAFGCIILLASATNESDQLQDFAGLARRSPWLAFLMMVLMFSLAGVPPFAGFWAKWFVLKEVIAAGYAWLAAVAVFFSIIGAYYYLRVVKLMYFDEPDAEVDAIPATEDVRLIFSVNGITILLLGLLPGTLMSVCVSAMMSY